MLRWLATAAILALLALDLGLPRIGLLHRGTETAVKADVAGLGAMIGKPFPDVSLPTLEGEQDTGVLRVADLRGHRVLLVFERSVDW